MAGKTRIFSGKKFGLLGVRDRKHKARALGLGKYGRTRVVKVKGGWATYFRSHSADKAGYD